MSVVTLLSAVSGTVAVINHHGGEKHTTATTATSRPVKPGAFASAALARNLRAVPVDRAADQRQLRLEAEAQRAAAVRKTAREAAQAQARAERKAAEAADRRREEIRQRASRSARRDPQQLARVMVAERGWSSSQFGCLQSLWNRESGWNYRASNPSSGAYGIPQALPGSKMASAGADWRTNPVTQMAWGLGYIADRYGTPCGAWGHSESNGWY